MKRSRFAAILIICMTFIYIAIEQEMGVGVLYEKFFPSDAIPVSATLGASINRNIPASGASDTKEPIISVRDNEPTATTNPAKEHTASHDSERRVTDGMTVDGTDSENTVKITVTAAGDCLLGFDETYGFTNSFMNEFERQNRDSGYFLKNFAELFESSDLTIVNLEAPLTNSIKKAEKEFAFKGLPEFTEILRSGNVDAVTIANNHTKDYGLEGYNETVANLEKASVLYFGNEYTALTEVSGIKIGMFGYSAWAIDNSIKKNISKQIESLREKGADLVIAYFHWGEERAALPNDIQKTYAYHSIDSGADLVLGTHPHVIQGIEEYKGRQIVYSFGNFCYGGAKNPSDKDTFVFRQTFSFMDGELIPDADIRIIPASISSVAERNNYQPTPLTGAEYDRVAEKIISRSESFNSADRLRQAMSSDTQPEGLQ